MKKVVCILLGLFMLVTTAGTVSAATASDSVISNLQKGATNANGYKIKVTTADLNQAKAYVAATPLTKAQASQVNEAINSARSIFGRATANNASLYANYEGLSATDQATLRSSVQTAANVLDLTVTWGSGPNANGFALVDSATGQTVYRPATATGSNGGSTSGTGVSSIVKQTGANYTWNFVAFTALILAGLAGFGMSRRIKVADR